MNREEIVIKNIQKEITIINSQGKTLKPYDYLVYLVKKELPNSIKNEIERLEHSIAAARMGRASVENISQFNFEIATLKGLLKDLEQGTVASDEIIKKTVNQAIIEIKNGKVPDCFHVLVAKRKPNEEQPFIDKLLEHINSLKKQKKYLSKEEMMQFLRSEQINNKKLSEGKILSIISALIIKDDKFACSLSKPVEYENISINYNLKKKLFDVYGEKEKEIN